MILCFSTNSYGAPYLSVITQRWCLGIGNTRAIMTWAIEQSGRQIMRSAGKCWVVLVPRPATATEPEKTE